MDKSNPNLELINFFFDPQNEDEETLREYFEETGVNIEAEEKEFKYLLKAKILNARAEETRKLEEMYLEDKDTGSGCNEEIEEAEMAYRSSKLKTDAKEKILERDKTKLAKLKEIKKRKYDINGDV